MKHLFVAFALLAFLSIAHGLVVSNNGLNLIKYFESFSPSAYYDKIGGKWTIGWGNTYWESGQAVKSGDTITQTRALALLRFWTDKTGFAVQTFLGSTSVTQNQFDALVSFAYNVKSWQTTNSGLMTMVKANPSNPGIRDQFMKYTNGGIAGLVSRRKAEADLYFKK